MRDCFYLLCADPQGNVIWLERYEAPQFTRMKSYGPLPGMGFSRPACPIFIGEVQEGFVLFLNSEGVRSGIWYFDMAKERLRFVMTWQNLLKRAVTTHRANHFLFGEGELLMNDLGGDKAFYLRDFSHQRPTIRFLSYQGYPLYIEHVLPAEKLAVATVAYRGRVEESEIGVIDLRSGQAVGPLYTYPSHVFSGAAILMGSYIVTGHEDGVINVWPLKR